MYVVLVDFRLNKDAMARFLPLMQQQAKTSLNEEEGCHHFDICLDEGDPCRIFLYEVYKDRAAFDAHLATAHFRDFDAAVAPLIAEKSVRTGALVAS